MSRPDNATKTLVCTSVMIAGTVMLSCSTPAYAGHNGGFREFRQQNTGLDAHSLKSLWQQSHRPPMFIQPTPTGSGGASGAPPITGITLLLPPMTTQPMPTGGGINTNAPPITVSGSTNSESPPLSIQPMPTGGGSNPDAPPVYGSRKGHNHTDRPTSLPPVTIQPMPVGSGSNTDAPPIPGVDPGSKSSNRHNIRSSQTDDAGSRIGVNGGIDIDLSSAEQNIRLGNRLFSGVESVTIDVGNGTKTLTAGSQVTAAEYVAARQVLSGSGQQLVLNTAGSAIGGTVDLSTVSSRSERVKVDDLSIPVNVSALGDFSKTPLFSVTGDLNNAGTIYAYSFGGNQHHGGISADNVTNESTGLISTQLPLVTVKHGVGHSERPVDLSIHADDTFSNFGTISSTGELILSAGNQVINGKNGVLSAGRDLSINAPMISNAGLISSDAGNVNLYGPSNGILQVTNGGGTIIASNGDINLRDASYNDVLNTYVTGGNLYSKAVNVNAGQGSAEINVDELTGTLNQKGAASHVATNTSTLKLGNICLTGDPTYSNIAGNISLDGNITVGEALSIIASGDITASVPLTLTANSPTQGFEINLVAGADITSGGTTTNVGPVPPAATSVVTSISGNPSATGGNIILGELGAVNINASSSSKSKTTPVNGGNVRLAAFRSAGGSNGTIAYTLGTITTGGKGTGTNGNVIIIAGSGTTTAFPNSIATINTTGGTGGGGDISFSGSQPYNINPITYAIDGTANNFLDPVGIVSPGIDLSFRGQLTAAGNVSINSGSLSWLAGSKVGISNSTTSGTINLHAFGNGIAIGNKNIFSTNTLLLNAGTGNIGQGGVVALQTNAAKIVANGDASFSEIVVVSSNKGLVLFNGSADTLNLSCAGTFMTDPSLAPITANTALIGSFGAGTGLNSFNPIEVAADNIFITAATKGDVFAHNSNATTTTLLDTGKMLANKTFSIVSDNDLSMLSTAFINADNVILTTANNFGSLNGTIDGDVSVTLTMKNDLTNANIPASTITPLLKLVSTTGNIGVSTAARYTVNTGALAVTATAAAAGKSVFLQGPVAKSFKLVGGTSSGVFDYSGPGSLIISGNLTSGNNSDIKVVIATGTLTTQAAQIHSGRDILLQVADTVSTKIKMVIGANTDIFTDSSPSAGQITFALGNITQVTGTPPAKGVSFAEFGAGADIFWGTAGISGKGQNFVIAQGADVTFSNSISSKAISLGGNVQITADPPITGSDTVVGGASAGRFSSGSSGFTASSLGTASGANSISSGNNFASSSVEQAASQSFGQNTNHLLNTAALAALSRNIGTTNINILTASQAFAVGRRGEITHRSKPSFESRR